MTSPSIYGVILAGGSGTRFWPKSRQRSPKQLCSLDGSGKTMLETTLGRLQGLIPPSQRLIVTHKLQASATKRLTKKSVKTVLAEPCARNTAAALALAALEINRLAKGKPTIMVSLHADHVIRNVPKFQETLRAAIKVAATGRLTLLGVVPKYPETGYGYIERGSAIAGIEEAFGVASFREKPPRAIATEYVQSGKFYWNSGLFVFPVQTLLDELRRNLPELMKPLEGFLAQSGSFAKIGGPKFAKLYAALPKISIDHAVLEKSKTCALVEADFGWQDVGSWDALGEAFGQDQDDNFTAGDTLLIDTTGSTVASDGPLIATIGLKDMIVVYSKGAILVCPKARAQDVKEIVEKLQANRRTEFL